MNDENFPGIGRVIYGEKDPEVKKINTAPQLVFGGTISKVYSIDLLWSLSAMVMVMWAVSLNASAPLAPQGFDEVERALHAHRFEFDAVRHVVQLWELLLFLLTGEQFAERVSQTIPSWHTPGLISGGDLSSMRSWHTPWLI